MTISIDYKKPGRVKKMYLKLKVMNIFVDFVIQESGVPEDKVDDELLHFAAGIAYNVFLDNTIK